MFLSPYGGEEHEEERLRRYIFFQSPACSKAKAAL
jgi:hypothetical protein